MRKIILALMLIGFGHTLQAQQTPLQKYDLIPAGYQKVYYDHVKDFVVRKLPSTAGTYFGQISDDGQLAGYAAYESYEGGTLIGQYYQGVLLFGITMTTKTISVGTKEFFASYSATTGQLLGVMQGGTLKEATPAEQRTYTFSQLTYNNGDRYVGELYNGQRHGYGIYYYKGGGFWYGQFQNNQRNGYGAMFTAKGGLQVGHWNTPKDETDKN